MAEASKMRPYAVAGVLLLKMLARPLAKLNTQNAITELLAALPYHPPAVNAPPCLKPSLLSNLWHGFFRPQQIVFSPEQPRGVAALVLSLSSFLTSLHPRNDRPKPRELLSLVADHRQSHTKL